MEEKQKVLNQANETTQQAQNYDFSQPAQFSPSQIEKIKKLHQIFARLSSLSLSNQIQTPVHFTLSQIDQIRFDKFGSLFVHKSLHSKVDMDPLSGSIIISLDSRIVAAMLTNLFGGQLSGGILIPKFTEAEISVMESLIVRLLGNLREAWLPIFPIKPRLKSVGTNFKNVEICEEKDMLVNTQFTIDIEGICGNCYIAIPAACLRPVSSQLQRSSTQAAPPPRKLIKYSTIKQQFTFENELQDWDALRKINQGSTFAINKVLSQQEVYTSAQGLEV